MQITYVLELLKPTNFKASLIEQNILEVQRNRISISNKLKEGNIKLSSKDFAQDLPSAVINQNIREVKALFKLFKKSKSKKDNIEFSKNQPLCFNNQNFRIQNHFVSFPLYNGKSKRYWFPLVKNNRLTKLQGHIDNGAKLGKASLFNKKGKYYFAVTIKINQAQAMGSNIMGIDIGLNQLAVASISNTSEGEIARQLNSGKEAGYIRKRNRSLRRKLGKDKKPKKIKALNDKESRYMTDLNHKISRKLINLAVQEGVSTVVMENLKNIRKNSYSKGANRNLHSWAFYQLQTFIEYKAKLAGMEVVYINPKYTSQACNSCGQIQKSNRDRNIYSCNCGYRVHADLNAARNIANICLSGKSLSA